VEKPKKDRLYKGRREVNEQHHTPEHQGKKGEMHNVITRSIRDARGFRKKERSRKYVCSERRQRKKLPKKISSPGREG